RRNNSAPDQHRGTGQLCAGKIRRLDKIGGGIGELVDAAGLQGVPRVRSPGNRCACQQPGVAWLVLREVDAASTEGKIQIGARQIALVARIGVVLVVARRSGKRVCIIETDVDAFEVEGQVIGEAE